LTGSADKTCKIWDIATSKCVQTFNVDPAPTNDHQIVGSLWQGQYLLAVGLNGYIYYLDEANPNKPLRVLKGHNKFITSFAYDPADKNFYTGSYDGIVHRWVEGQGSTDGISGTAHSNEITGSSIDSHHKHVYTPAAKTTLFVSRAQNRKHRQEFQSQQQVCLLASLRPRIARAARSSLHRKVLVW